MTDFGSPTSPAEALRRKAKEFAGLAKQHREAAQMSLRLAEAFEEQRHQMESDADRYDKYQPTLEASGKDS